MALSAATKGLKIYRVPLSYVYRSTVYMIRWLRILCLSRKKMTAVLAASESSTLRTNKTLLIVAAHVIWHTITWQGSHVADPVP